ncbi:hypothetical protein BLNAU_24808 [Blattamonas nauphoetae]|uniref:Uncharacterized protein n=1 Tax=Blattamonas nauphoetae TaxID=2049346 RepID=A0ABQ9WLE4_9EUKA|nr:hypothetical protein BLNAU_24808 [Blattamonas nauphoetae]
MISAPCLSDQIEPTTGSNYFDTLLQPINSELTSLKEQQQRLQALVMDLTSQNGLLLQELARTNEKHDRTIENLEKQVEILLSQQEALKRRLASEFLTRAQMISIVQTPSR